VAAFLALLEVTGVTAGLMTLAVSVLGIVGAARRPAGRVSGRVRPQLHPLGLALLSVLFLGGIALLWRKIPWSLSPSADAAVRLGGGLVYLSGLALYLWGRRSLGRMFAASTGAAARLPEEPRLVTGGPYAWVRHPMYVAVFLVAAGGLLLFQTWAMVLLMATAAALPRRARLEEALLVSEFGSAWTDYARRVPKWIPGLRQSDGEDRNR
jgi:protein-S-isoprenylcysteine O-methyltransferase Ste14